MTNSIPLGTIIRIFLAMASMAASLNSYAVPGKEPASTPTVTPAAKYQAVAEALLKEKEKQLVKAAGEAVAETGNALDALKRNHPKEALADLDVVTLKLYAVLARDAAMKEAPFKAEASVVNYDGSRDSVQEAVKKARDLAGTQHSQAVRQILDQLVSEIRITVTSLPLKAYSRVIELATSLIGTGQNDKAKAMLDDAINRLPVTTTNVYPLPILAAEESLMEAWRIEQSTDSDNTDKEEKQKKILSMVDEASLQLELAEALGYGTKNDYQTLYQGIKALKEAIQTGKFQAEWENLHTSLLEFKGRLVQPTK